MEGGKLIAKGSKSCVFIPNLPCSGSNSVNNDKISKIMYGKKAKKLIKQEKKLNKRIISIKNSKKWAVTFEEYCNPLELIELSTYDHEGIQDCLRGEDYKLAIKFNEYSQMMIGDYGGVTLDEYFINHFSNIKNFKKMEKDFFDLIKMMKTLFIGLVELEKHQIVHKDIKYNNIVLHNGHFKFIDFGLSSLLNDKKHFKERSRSEFSTSRIYTWYPIEYIFNYATDQELRNEIKREYIGNLRNGIDLYKEIHSIYNRDFRFIMDTCIHRINQKLINKEKMFQGIDIYSLGIMIPSLFLTKSNIQFPFEKSKSKLISDFYLLCGKMTEPYYEDRISAKNALKELNKIIK